MRSLLIPLAAALVAAGAATAADTAKPATGALAVAFGNTVKATYPDGRFQRYWFERDGTWHAIGRRGTPSSGTWTQSGERVCMKQRKPFGSPFNYCTTFPADGAIGSSWPAKDAGGGKITLSLVKGGVVKEGEAKDASAKEPAKDAAKKDGPAKGEH